MELVASLTQSDVCGKYPQITQRHAYRVQVGQLLQDTGSAIAECLNDDDRTRQDDDHPDTVDICVIFVLLQQSLRDKLTSLLVVQQHAQRRIDAQNKRRELTDGIADRVDDLERITDTIVCAELFKCPVRTVRNVSVLICHDFFHIEHHAHSNGAQDRADHDHDGQGDHTLRESLGRIFYLIDIRRDLLTSADGEDEDTQ